MRSAEMFWDNMAQKYSKSPIKDMDAYNATLDRTRAHLKADDTILELGCGTGSTVLLLADCVRHITATDISANMIEIGQGEATEQGIGNVAFVQSTLWGDTLEAGSYDVVLALNLLHLVENPGEALARIHELVKPGGLLISKTACLGGRITPWRFVVPLMQMVGVAPYVGFLKVQEFEDLITATGFEILEAGSYPETSQSRYIVARRV